MAHAGYELAMFLLTFQNCLYSKTEYLKKKKRKKLVTIFHSSIKWKINLLTANLHLTTSISMFLNSNSLRLLFSYSHPSNWSMLSLSRTKHWHVYITGWYCFFPTQYWQVLSNWSTLPPSSTILTYHQFSFLYI